jgi:uncharacterized protein YeaO (DUF488 family)
MAKGHLQLVSLSHLKDIDLSLYPKRLFIVRSMSKVTPEALHKHGLVHVPQLSPSSALFSDYINRWLKGDFTAEERSIISKGSTNSWWDVYTQRFVVEMQSRNDMRKCLQRIEDLLNQGVNVLLVCYCTNPFRCHRGILGYYFMQRGFQVNFD